MLTIRQTISIFVVLGALALGCTADDTPDELPFDDRTLEEPTDSPSTVAPTPATDTVDDASLPVEEVFESVGVEDELAACYAEILGESGLGEIDDLRQLADIDPEDQAALNECLTP